MIHHESVDPSSLLEKAVKVKDISKPESLEHGNVIYVNAKDFG